MMAPTGARDDGRDAHDAEEKFPSRLPDTTGVVPGREPADPGRAMGSVVPGRWVFPGPGAGGWAMIRIVEYAVDRPPFPVTVSITS